MTPQSRWPYLGQAGQWAIILGLPAVLTVVYLGQATLLLPLGGTLGVFIGLTSTAPYFTATFKITILLALLACGLLIAAGLRFRRGVFGKAMVVVGLYAWCVVGLVAFGPQ